MNRGLTNWCCAVMFALGVYNAPGQTALSAASSSGGFSADDQFHAGWHEATVGVAPLFSPVGPMGNHPRVNYVMLFAQAGYMINDVHGDGFFRGNFEFVPEVFGAGIYEATGHYLAGTTVSIRQNFVPKNSRLVPYGQIGMGLSSMDIDHKYDGHNFNFNLDSSLGVRCFLRPRLSLNAELRYQHISNANTGSHNIGINALGPALGVSWHF